MEIFFAFFDIKLVMLLNEFFEFLCIKKYFVIKIIRNTKIIFKLKQTWLFLISVFYKKL